MDPSFPSSIRAHTNPRSSNRRGAERDAWLLRLAAIGPLWVDVLLRLRLFPSRQTAERRLKRLEASGRLHYAGRIDLGSGRRSHVWCNRAVPRRMLHHETDVMRVFYAFWPHAYARTGADVDPRYRADMELTIGPVGTGRTYMVEIDEGTEPLARVRSRLASYEGCPRTRLVTAPTLARAAEILRQTQDGAVYVTTIERCVSDPWGRHWTNCLGETGTVAFPAASGVAPGVADAR